MTSDERNVFSLTSPRSKEWKTGAMFLLAIAGVLIWSLSGTESSAKNFSFALFAFGAMLFAIAILLTGSITLEIGNTGIRVRRDLERDRFYAFHDVASVRRHGAETVVHFSNAEPLVLRDVPPMIQLDEDDLAKKRVEGEAAANLLARKLAAFRAAASDIDEATYARLEPRLEPFQTTLQGWRNGSYRDASPSEEEAATVLANVAAPPPLRTRAAALLAGSEGGRARIRLAASEADDLGPILTRIADAADDDAIAAIVESEDSPRKGSSR